MKRFQTVALIVLGLLTLTLPVPRCGGDADAASGVHASIVAPAVEAIVAPAVAGIPLD